MAFITTRRMCGATLALATALAMGGCQPYGPAPAPELRLTNVQAITDSILRGIVLPGDGIAAIEVSNPGPAIRLEAFEFQLKLGEADYGHGRFRGDLLMNEGTTRMFNVPIVSQYIPAVRMTLNRAKPLRIEAYTVTFVDANNQRRTEYGPGKAP